MTLNFEVKRKRFSVTQQEAHVYCNGKFIINFGDEPKIINPGDKYYGELIGGWASTKPDSQFISSALYHKYDEIYHISDGIKKIIDEAIEDEVKTAKIRRPKMYNGKQVMKKHEFSYSTAKIGDLVEAEFVMDAMDLLPPASMRLSCAQVGEPYSHREDPDTGKWKATYSTFKCLEGGWDEGVWEYCGNCFRGETTERGKDPVYC